MQWLKLFRKFNTSLPSSAPVERMFNSAGGIFTKRRQSLTDEHFEMQLLLKINQNFWKNWLWYSLQSSLVINQCTYILVKCNTMTIVLMISASKIIPLVKTSKKRYILTILKCECGCEVRPGKKHTCVRSACEAKSEVRKSVRAVQKWSHLNLW